jgi:hypothetical protein
MISKKQSRNVYNCKISVKKQELFLGQGSAVVGLAL